MSNQNFSMFLGNGLLERYVVLLLLILSNMGLLPASRRQL